MKEQLQKKSTVAGNKILKIKAGNFIGFLI
jgi:hypothetical protein